MVVNIQAFSNWSLQNLEASVLPTEGDLLRRTAVYAYQFCVFLPLTRVSSPFSFVVTQLLAPKQEDSPLIAFAKHPQFVDALRTRAPVALGAATAEFQDEGPNVHQETQFGKIVAAQKVKSNLGQLPTG